MFDNNLRLLILSYFDYDNLVVITNDKSSLLYQICNSQYLWQLKLERDYINYINKSDNSKDAYIYCKDNDLLKQLFKQFDDSRNEYQVSLHNIDWHNMENKIINICNDKLTKFNQVKNLISNLLAKYQHRNDFNTVQYKTNSLNFWYSYDEYAATADDDGYEIAMAKILDFIPRPGQLVIISYVGKETSTMGFFGEIFTDFTNIFAYFYIDNQNQLKYDINKGLLPQQLLLKHNKDEIDKLYPGILG